MSSQATVGPARRRSGGLDRDRYRRDMVTDAYHRDPPFSLPKIVVMEAVDGEEEMTNSTVR
jgi:hypothetical protein